MRRLNDKRETECHCIVSEILSISIDRLTRELNVLKYRASISNCLDFALRRDINYKICVSPRLPSIAGSLTHAWQNHVLSADQT